MSRARSRSTARRAGTRLPAARMVVVTEGASTEPKYLRVFEGIHGNRQILKLDIIPRAGDPRAVVECAIKESKKLKKDRLATRDSVWAMFDRDEHPRFEEAKNLARGKGIRLAVSNPCFELWGIFHYKECDGPLDRHQCQQHLGELCAGYSRRRGKIFDDQKVIKRYHEDAVQRAETSLAHREAEGSPEGNPSTTVHLLTEHIQKFGK